MKFKSSYDPKKKRKPNLTQPGQMQLPADYPWKVINWLSSDLESELSFDDRALLSQIIRDRDISALLLLNDCWGLQSINSQKDVEPLSRIRAKYLFASLLKKFQFPTERHERLATAIKKFKQAEEVCRDYNRVGYKKLLWSENEFGAEVLTYARSYLKKVLGPVPNKEIVTRWSRHGPGSNLDTERGNISQYAKYKNYPYSVTQRALPYARFLISTDQRWMRALTQDFHRRFRIPMCRKFDSEKFWSYVLKVVKGNRITFVSKDALTERSIAIEPTMNLMLQLGVDGHIRSRLKRWGIDLDSQKANQFMAYLGSARSDDDDSYVTLDMKMASDTNAKMSCSSLLPEEWYQYLSCLRSPCGKLDDDIIYFEKMSSMGNGYTFVLESAIFAAITYAVIKASKGTVDMKSDFNIYGDDLVCRKDVAPLVIKYLEICGYSLNLGKSFLDGPVRESCGSDWFNGKPVRPVFFKELPTDVMGLFTDINRLKRLLSLRWGIEESKTVSSMRKWIPERFQGFQGPYSDTDFDTCLHRSRPLFQSYSRCRYKYQRLEKKPTQLSCNDLYMRLLMHDLRGRGETSVNRFATEFQKVSAGGDRFAVLKSYALTVSKTYSHPETWCGTYAEDCTPNYLWLDHSSRRLLPRIVGLKAKGLYFSG